MPGTLMACSVPILSVSPFPPCFPDVLYSNINNLFVLRSMVVRANQNANALNWREKTRCALLSIDATERGQRVAGTDTAMNV
jgi:hypothetical protein